jgi:hypothetical protein
MRLIDTHRLLLVEVVVLMSKKTFGRVEADSRISLAPGRRKARWLFVTPHTSTYAM